jgi:phosphonate transport system permease protein
MVVTAPAKTAPPAGRPPGLSGPVPVGRLRPQTIAAVLTLIALLAFSVYSLLEVGISIPNMVASWGNAVNFFNRVGTITFPPPGELLSLTALTLGIVISGTVLAAVLSIPVRPGARSVGSSACSAVPCRTSSSR